MKTAIIFTILVLVLLAGCATKNIQSSEPTGESQDTVAGSDVLTDEGAIAEIDKSLIAEDSEVDVGEMI